jgi:hypothetical protein
LLVYGELYESAFFVLIFALSNGLILARKMFKGVEMVLFLIIAGASFVCELAYASEIHRQNMYIFAVLSLICLSGVIRTYFLLKRSYHAIEAFD